MHLLVSRAGLKAWATDVTISCYWWAVVGSTVRDYLSILARSARLDEGTYAAAFETSRRQGFDPATLVCTR